jgi:hypothetical protein
MNKSAGKRSEFSSGTNYPEAMIKIHRDLSILSLKNPSSPKSSLLLSIKYLKTDLSALNTEISSFKSKQKYDFSMIFEFVKEIQSMMPK